MRETELANKLIGVQKIEILHTILQTINNRKVVVPNGSLMNNVIVNAASAEKRRLEIKAGIAYEDNLSEAKAVLERLVKEEEKVLDGENIRFMRRSLPGAACCWGCAAG